MILASNRSDTGPAQSGVTIVIPFSGETEYQFRMSVQSVFAQSYKNWSLLLIGDAPSEALRILSGKILDPRVRVVMHDRQMGLATRLNESVEYVATEYYVRMDADDVMAPRRVETLMSSVATGPVVDVVGSRAFVVDHETVISGVLREPAGIPGTADEMARSNVFTHPTVMVRTSWLRANPYCVGIGRVEDMELWLRSGIDSTFLKLEDRLLYYRVSGEYQRMKWVRTAFDSGRLLLRSGTYGVSHRRRIIGSIEAMAKAAFYLILPSNSWTAVRGRRVEILGSDDLEAANSDLSDISSTSVSGWN